MGNQRYLAICIFFVLLCASAYSNPADTTRFSRGDDFEIKLVTIGPGDDLTSWWGHTAVIVEDKRMDASLFYNYGLFSFEEENFFLNFAMGRLIFWVGAWQTRSALAFYVSLNREIYFQVLNLSAEKKLELATLLAENIQPQNREYLYDHYRDNCSTRVRDLIDRIVDGQFKAKMQNPGRMTFRDHTRRHTARSFPVDWVLMFLMNNSIDEPIRVWDDMFLPEELAGNLSGFTYIDAEGKTQKIVEIAYTYFPAKNREAVPAQAAAHWPTGLLIGLLTGFAGAVLAVGYKLKKRYFTGLFSAYQAIIALALGIPGLVLFFMGFFTDHRVTFHNENLLLANPLTLL
ncbi:MAG: DUF4105 domain-containing protein, partial [Calditrichales bacterium]